jgi:hypothetical protein
MSQSPTTAGSQASQEDTYNQGLYLIERNHIPDLDYPDRLDFAYSSQESIAYCSLGVPLTQLSDHSPPLMPNSVNPSDPMLMHPHISPHPTQSVSATPTPPDGHEKLRDGLARMNNDLRSHGYDAFVRGSTHYMIKTYHGIDLERK